MSLYDAGSIDLLGQLPDGTVTLSIVHDGTWVDTDDERAALSDKVNAYLSYALDGALTQDFPELVGEPVVIQIESHHHPLERTGVMIERWADEVVVTTGVRLELRIAT